MDCLRESDPKLFKIIEDERKRQDQDVELIASENFTSKAVRQATGTVLTNKYAEGYVGKRYYGGCQHVDRVERLAIDRAKRLFGVEYVNVQPHSGSQANAAVYLALMEPGERFLAFDLSHGGHLSHGSSVNFSGQVYEAHHYGVDKSTGRIDTRRVRSRALEVQPKVILMGASAYSRDFDYEAFREIADEVGAYLWMDMAHTAGLIASGVLKDPTPYVDVLTTTTHKTLRGPRSGMILSNDPRLGKAFDKAVFPGTQGGPLVHVIAAKAVAFHEALKPDFVQYSEQVVKNAQAMADEMSLLGFDVVTGGTDNHCFLVDLRNRNLTGKQAERALGEEGITLNKNMIPYDPESPFVTSGVRIGTPAMTTRGYDEDDFREVARKIDKILS
jgi:glycine hydroxymethyltransferase